MTDSTDSAVPDATLPAGHNTTCGGAGGITGAGLACRRPQGWGTPHRGTGRCRLHASRADGGKWASTNGNRDAFLAAFAASGNITVAATTAGIARTTHYAWLRDPEYAARFIDAERVAVGVLLDEAHRRAVDGVEEPVGWFQGAPGGYVRKYSDTLLIFLIKGSIEGHRFRERQEITGAGGGPLTVADVSAMAAMSPAELAAIRDAAIAKALPPPSAR